MDEAARVIARLKEKGLTLATAESCTGGLLGKRLTDVAGSSAVYLGGVISYAYAVKEALLGVDAALLREKGAVCAEVAEQMACGMDMGVARVPIVPAAVLFDLSVGDSHIRPDAAMGRTACMNAAKGMAQGRVGAGTGATVGKLITAALPQDSGVGSASITLPEGVTVGAVVAVNACGDVYHPETGAVIGCAHMSDGTPVLAEGLLYGHAPAPQQMRIPAPGSNTTIGVVAVDCKLTKEQANRLADVSHDGLARTIRPVHTQMDGDTMFALGTGRVDADVNFVKLCAAAAEVTARAIANALLFSRL